MREVNHNLSPARSFDFTSEDDGEQYTHHTGYSSGGAGYVPESYRTDSIIGHQAHAQVLPVAFHDHNYMSPRVTSLHARSFSHVHETPLNNSGAGSMPISSQSFNQSSPLAYGPYATPFHAGLPGFHSCNPSISQFSDEERYLQTYGLSNGSRLTTMTDNCSTELTSGSGSTSPNSLNSSTIVPVTPGADQCLPLTPSSMTSPHPRPRRSIPKEEPLPFQATEIVQQIICDGKHVTPDIQANVAKNVFNVENTWTCYRRNYISVECSFTLGPSLSSGRLYLMPDGQNEPRLIQAFAIKLDGRCDGAEGKEIELVQHTPKRDKGIKSSVEMKKLGPDIQGQNASSFSTQISPPILPLQYEPEDGLNCPLEPMTASPPLSNPSQQTRHTFERIQFKNATANNGRRRAQQQYYHLVLALWADIRPSNEFEAEWVKVAHRVSDPMVVRGRSPGHYTDARSTNDSSGGYGGPGGSGAHGGSGSLGLSHGPRSAAAKPSKDALSNSTQANNVQMFADGAASSLRSSHSDIACVQHTHRVDSSSHFVPPNVLSHSGDYGLNDAEVPYLMKPADLKYCNTSMHQGATNPILRQTINPEPQEPFESVWSRRMNYDTAYSGTVRPSGHCGRFESQESNRNSSADMMDAFPHSMFTSMA